MASDASHMLAAALEQMDDIIAGKSENIYVFMQHLLKLHSKLGTDYFLLL